MGFYDVTFYCIIKIRNYFMKTRIRYGKIAKNILFTLAVAGVVVIAASSPYFLINLSRAIKKDKNYRRRQEKKEFEDKTLARSLAGLNKNKMIVVRHEGNNYTIKLTEKGKKIVQKIQFENMAVEKQEKWDGKWRIIIFDIPEGNKRRGKVLRDAMRDKMKKMNFYQLQKSVWAHAYPCEKEIKLLCEILNVSPFVNIITAEKIYNDDVLRKYFKC